MISRLSSCSFGISTKRSSKKYTRSRRPSQLVQVEPAGSSADAVRPISSAAPAAPPLPASHRAAHRHRESATRLDMRGALARVRRRHRPPPRRPHAADASVATMHGRAGNQGGKLSAKRSREATTVELGLTRRQSIHRTINAQDIRRKERKTNRAPCGQPSNGSFQPNDGRLPTVTRLGGCPRRLLG